MLIGYARVSTHDQTLNLQLDALKNASCEQIFTDHISGTKAERPGLQEAFSHIRAGDTLVVWRLDRLGRSLRHLIDTITKLEKRTSESTPLQRSVKHLASHGQPLYRCIETGKSAEGVEDAIVAKLQESTRACQREGGASATPVGSARGQTKT
jgi:DNA invertase Pin-like site-specific DNA recombinase